MNRDQMLTRIARQQQPWDMAVIGGGATGAGIALDAASRGYSVVLLEQSDFGKGTSSRSTKLVHGGVRYLQQGNVSLVKEGLRERTLLHQNAPHLVTRLPLIIPAYEWWERAWYGTGLKLYDLLAGRCDFAPSRVVSRDDTIRTLPTLRPDGLKGGVLFHDGQFDDARLLIHLAWTAAEQGAALLNYARVSGVSKNTAGAVDGVVVEDVESARELRLAARVVVNATGAFVDDIRQFAAPDVAPMVTLSQGTHIVLSRGFLPGDTAIMVPRVGDGRVLFAIPWNGHTLVGTTDTPIAAPAVEPQALGTEVDFLLETAGRYLRRPPRREDVMSVFTGIRPLVSGKTTHVTAALSRDHTIHVDPSGLVTTTGGKWTTYRRMAEDTVDRAASVAGLPRRPNVTPSLRIHGFDTDAARHGALRPYGADAPAIIALSSGDHALGERLHPELTLTAAEVIWGARHEMARTLEDVLARRARALFLNARAAVEVGPRVVSILARELARDAAWERSQVAAFAAIAETYIL
ncbi:MAG: FAD-dependent oxidoreductase [Vicinamibacterales bacterium]